MMTLNKIVGLLDRELDIARIPDSSHNGLQVQNSGKVKKVCCGVDASMEFFEAAKKRGADMLICHHGLSWRDSMARITDLNYSRIRYLIENDMALYAAHLPLDAHHKLGNNVLICKALGLRYLKPFGWHEGFQIGFRGSFLKPVSYTSFKKKVARVMGNGPELKCMDFGRKTIKTVAVVSGGAAGDLGDAASSGADVYLTGEPNLNAYSVAQEMKINAVFAGHYATETFGVKAVADFINKKRLGISAEFIDLEVGY